VKQLVLAVALALCGFSAAQAAMSTAPYLGPNPGSAEPNRLTGSGSDRTRGANPSLQFIPSSPYLSLAPSDLQTRPEKRQRSGPGFLNADPFDPNSVVNRYDRSLYANPYPYDPVYNPYGQGDSGYAPRGGSDVPMGNGIPWGR
jgi:hypothetical protein